MTPSGAARAETAPLDEFRRLRRSKQYMDSVEFAIGTPLVRADLEGLCARICRLLARGEPRIALCDCAQIDRVDAVMVDALARLQLAARRRGCEVHLLNASPELRELVALMGLEDVLLESR